jgi:hypothetical protein
MLRSGMVSTPATGRPGEGARVRVAFVTIGQAPRDDVVQEMLSLSGVTSGEVEYRQAGAIPFLLGRGDLVLPLLGGVALAMLADASMLPATDPACANRTDQPRSSDRVHRDLRLSLSGGASVRRGGADAFG